MSTQQPARLGPQSELIPLLSTFISQALMVSLVAFLEVGVQQVEEALVALMPPSMLNLHGQSAQVVQAFLLWPLELVEVGPQVVPSVLVSIQPLAPHTHHPALPCHARSSHIEPNHTTSLHDPLLLSWHPHWHVGSGDICLSMCLTSLTSSPEHWHGSGCS